MARTTTPARQPDLGTTPLDDLEETVKDEREYFDHLTEVLYTGVVSDVLDSLGFRHQAMTAGIRPVYHGAKLVGRAHTMVSEDVDELPADPYEFEIAAIDAVPENGIVVAATGGSIQTCLWGELLSTATRVRGGRGAVIDGYTRDVERISGMNFPVFATGMRPVDSAGRGKVVAFNETIECGGVTVAPGDIVVADIDGIVVIPQQVEEEAIRLAIAKAQGENEMRQWLEDGNTLRSAFDHFGFL